MALALRSLLTGVRKSPVTARMVPTWHQYLRTLVLSEVRHSSYRASEPVDSVKAIPFDSSKNPEEWKFVERLLPSKLIPEPDRTTTSSVWFPQTVNASETPYFVKRSKNHMIPVYLKIEQRGLKRRTVIKNIQGDIWLMQRHIQERVESRLKKTVGMKVHEPAGKITLRGDHVCDVLQWMKEKGF